MKTPLTVMALLASTGVAIAQDTDFGTLDSILRRQEQTRQEMHQQEMERLQPEADTRVRSVRRADHIQPAARKLLIPGYQSAFAGANTAISDPG
jgi:hypothetical protein